MNESCSEPGKEVQKGHQGKEPGSGGQNTCCRSEGRKKKLVRGELLGKKEKRNPSRRSLVGRAVPGSLRWGSMRTIANCPS